MSYREDMDRVLAFVKDHAAEDLTAQTLADLCGYSYSHFCHVFKSICGVSVGVYLRHKRLFDALLLMQNGNSVTDAAFASGFETVSGFERAFRRLFGEAPSVYLKKKQGVFGMLEPKFEQKKAFCAAGYLLRLLPEENSDTLCYFLGPEVAADADVPAAMRLLTFPQANYAVFTVPKADTPQALSENVSAAWRYIFGEWFEQSGYAFDKNARDYERYHGEETCIYVPVIKD